MKKNRFVMPLLLSLGLVSASSCALFNDDDIIVKNEYNVPDDSEPYIDPDAVVAGGVVGKEDERTPDALAFKSICYAENGEIKNTYGSGGAHYSSDLGYNVNNGEDYPANKSTNNYDLYVPNNLDKTAKQTVILFIHGGAWTKGFKTDVNPYVHEFANRGYITATIKYTLLSQDMDDPSLSLFRDLDEIDACIKSIKNVLGELEFDTTKLSLVLGGASSGAHLAMLYSYSRGSELESSFPIKFLVNAVGPVDIKPANPGINDPGAWCKFVSATDEVLDAGLTYSAIKSQYEDSNLTVLPVSGMGYNWTEYETMRIANGMCGLPHPLEEIVETSDDDININHPNEASNLMVNYGEDLISVTHYINSSYKLPMVCAYGGKDSVVGVAQYARLDKALTDAGIDHELHYFKNSNHTDIGKLDEEASIYEGFIDAIENRCEAI